MANRIVTYQQAFEEVLGLKFSDKLKAFVARLEKEGHTEKSICFTVWKKQDKLRAFKNDSRFLSVLENEVNKWSWKKDDPRWKEYWKRKEEEEKAKRLRKGIEAMHSDEQAMSCLARYVKKPPKKPEGFIYFMQGQCGGPIKIGCSSSPEKRLKELQTGYPDTLVLLLMIPGNEAIERALHRQFKASKLKGEWFRPDDYVVEAIKELRNKFGTR